jgi:predicted nucleotidyltransferase
MKTLQLLQKNRKKIYEIANKYGVSNIRVFGSVARGEETKNSDVDLLVTLTKHRGMGLDLVRFEREVGETFKVKTDVVLEDGVHRLLKNKIFDEAVLL